MRRRSRGDRVQGVRLNPHVVDRSATLDHDARAMDDMGFCNVVDVPYVRRMMYMPARTTETWASTVVVEAVGSRVLNPRSHQLNPTSQRWSTIASRATAIPSRARSSMFYACRVKTVRRRMTARRGRGWANGARWVEGVDGKRVVGRRREWRRRD